MELNKVLLLLLLVSPTIGLVGVGHSRHTRPRALHDGGREAQRQLAAAARRRQLLEPRHECYATLLFQPF